MYNAQEQLHSFLRNFPNRSVAFLLRCIIFPRGRTYSSPSDELGRKLVSLITETGEARERLSEQAFKACEPGSPLGQLQEALELSEKHLPLEKKLKQAHREGLIKSEYLGHQIDEAKRAEVISTSEAAALRDYHEKVQFLMSVDDFAPDMMGCCTGPSKTAATEVVKPKVPTSPKKATKIKKKTRKKKSKAKK
tara:strand:+ start:7 stop:585 length:579 start_codon:yes stop_codon:yes gene_type:complete